jgi:hypothetical protein
VLRELPDLDAATLGERAVLGDELQQRGDPQGELIALQLALRAIRPESPPVRRAILERKIAALLDRHHDTLYGAIAPHVQRRVQPDVGYPVLEVKRWEAGFADVLWMQDTKQGPTLADAYSTVATLPIARATRRLLLGRGDMPSAIAAITAQPLPALRGLLLGDHSHTATPYAAHVALADTDPLAELVAGLEELCIMSYATVPRPLRSRSLRSLVLSTNTYARFADNDLPALEHLVLRLFVVEAALFERHAVAELRLDGCRLLPGALEAALRHAGRIRRLTLSQCRLGDAGLELVAREAEYVAWFEHLALDDQLFTDAGIAAVRDRLPASVRIGRYRR